MVSSRLKKPCRNTDSSISCPLSNVTCLRNTVL